MRLLLLLLASLAQPPPAPGKTPARVHALLVNGGGSPDINFHSHLSHLEKLVALLDRAGIPRDRVTVLASDGDSPQPDLASSDEQPEGFWLIEPTALGSRLAPRPKLIDSRLPGVKLAPATRASVQRTFLDLGRRLQAGDTLLLYVTDHGDEQKRDPLGNRIVLWGRGESLTVRQLRALIARLPAGVRVVSLMSQCFSGGFAHLADGPEGSSSGGLPDGRSCGYFSSTADRPAYGCYPESAGDDQIGHSFEFFQNLVAGGGAFSKAHEGVLVGDRTPDVPLRSSDVFLQNQLARAAQAAGTDPVVFADALIAEGFRDRARFEPELRLLDRIGAAFGMTSPRSIAGLEESSRRLRSLMEQLEAHGKAWDDVQSDLAQSNLQRFVQAQPVWQKRLAIQGHALAEPARVHLLRDLLAALVPFSQNDRASFDRLEQVAAQGERAQQAAYRLEVRLAAVLRLRTILDRIAGVTLLGRPDRAAAARALDRLRACEAFSLPLPPPATPPPTPEPYPGFDEEMKLAAEVLPAWMGISFRPAPRVPRLTLPAGAAQILAVFPDSPAKKAGLEVGDVVLGPPGAPFDEPNEVRTWTVLSVIGKPQPLVVVRDGQRRTVTLVPAARPVTWPELPGPPKVGTAAPPLRGQAFRGTLPATLVGKGEHLLFFWATWCAPCKAAVPEVMAFAQARQVPVVAITDEPRETLQAFFARWKQPFPAVVVSDEARGSFSAYGVSGTPTFVLVGADGVVRGLRTGYAPDQGLPVPGWRWQR